MVITYDFQAITDTEYICYLVAPVSGQRLSKMFSLALKKANKKEVDLDAIEEFTVANELLRGVNYAVKPIMGKLKKQLAVVVQSYNVTKAVYKKDGDNWICKIKLEGYYVG